MSAAISVIVCLIFLLASAPAEAGCPNATLIVDQLTWKNRVFRVLAAPDPGSSDNPDLADRFYHVEVCEGTRCTRRNFDKSVPVDSPDWPVRLNNLLIVDDTVWLGSSYGIYVYQDKQNSWTRKTSKDAIYDVTSLLKVGDSVFATREGGADVCGIYRWDAGEKNWQRIAEPGCFAYMDGAAVGSTLYALSYHQITAVKAPDWKIDTVKWPAGISSVERLAPQGNALQVMGKDKKGRPVIYTYTATKAKWTQHRITPEPPCSATGPLSKNRVK